MFKCVTLMIDMFDVFTYACIYESCIKWHNILGLRNDLEINHFSQKKIN